MDLLDHLGARGCLVPRFIADREGKRLQQLAGRPACLIEFLTGISVTEPTVGQARAAGAALGEMHRAAEGFTGERRNALDLPGRSEEHTSELQSLMRISYAVFCLKKNNKQ